MNDLNMARKWAKASKEPHMGEYEGAAAEAILSLPDEWIDAEKVRALIASLNAWTEEADADRSHGRALGYRIAAENLAALLPAPPLRTLSDMTPEERERCRWMQCKEAHFPTGGTGAQGIILTSGETSSLILERNGAAVTWNNRLVTPLPDLPKLVWPSLSVSGESEAVSAGTEESEGLPRPADVPAGEPWIVLCGGKRWVGVHADTLDLPWSITRMDGLDYQNVSDSEITLVSRLAPEVTA